MQTLSKDMHPKLHTDNSSPPIEIYAQEHFPIGLPAHCFLRDYWQKRPLLIRNAFPEFTTPITPEDLAGLACEDLVLARIITHDRSNDQWQVQHGPFPETLFPTLQKQDWTLLVQDVEKWDQDVAILLDSFKFLPRWRIDDIMISFAAPGGSVGPHIDQYDVFLLQAQGHRQWQIDSTPNPPSQLRQNTELQLLQQLNPTHDWILAPGDMLYLPPGVPHHGIAQDACLTYSIGMRAPAIAEILCHFVDSIAKNTTAAQRYF